MTWIVDVQYRNDSLNVNLNWSINPDFKRHPFASALTCALIAHHSTNLADTLASELGILSNSKPFLIISGRTVPPGTNGGVTALGTAFSALGGCIIGIGWVVRSLKESFVHMMWSIGLCTKASALHCSIGHSFLTTTMVWMRHQYHTFFLVQPVEWLEASLIQYWWVALSQETMIMSRTWSAKEHHLILCFRPLSDWHREQRFKWPTTTEKRNSSILVVASVCHLMQYTFQAAMYFLMHKSTSLALW